MAGVPPPGAGAAAAAAAPAAAAPAAALGPPGAGAGAAAAPAAAAARGGAGAPPEPNFIERVFLAMGRAVSSFLGFNREEIRTPVEWEQIYSLYKDAKQRGTLVYNPPQWIATFKTEIDKRRREIDSWEKTREGPRPESFVGIGDLGEMSRRIDMAITAGRQAHEALFDIMEQLHTFNGKYAKENTRRKADPGYKNAMFMLCLSMLHFLVSEYDKFHERDALQLISQTARIVPPAHYGMESLNIVTNVLNANTHEPVVLNLSSWKLAQALNYFISQLPEEIRSAFGIVPGAGIAERSMLPDLEGAPDIVTDDDARQYSELIAAAKERLLELQKKIPTIDSRRNVLDYKKLGDALDRLEHTESSVAGFLASSAGAASGGGGGGAGAAPRGGSNRDPGIASMLTRSNRGLPMDEFNPGGVLQLSRGAAAGGGGGLLALPARNAAGAGAGAAALAALAAGSSSSSAAAAAPAPLPAGVLAAAAAAPAPLPAGFLAAGGPPPPPPPPGGGAGAGVVETGGAPKRRRSNSANAGGGGAGAGAGAGNNANAAAAATRAVRPRRDKSNNTNNNDEELPRAGAKKGQGGGARRTRRHRSTRKSHRHKGNRSAHHKGNRSASRKVHKSTRKQSKKHHTRRSRKH